MPERGGPTTQSGIHYQNSVAALYLGRLLDSEKRPTNEMVEYVRVEAHTDVDDIVVKFADGSHLFIQAKENVKTNQRAWQDAWQAFDKQFRSSEFKRSRDRLKFQIGERHNDHNALREMCKRSSTAQSVTEWHERLTQKHKSLLEKIRATLPPESLSDEHLCRLLGHVEVEITPFEILERDYLKYWMPASSQTTKVLFRLLRDKVEEEAKIRGGINASSLRSSLKADDDTFQLERPPDIVALQQNLKQSNSLLRAHKSRFADTDIHLPRKVFPQLVDWLLTSNSDEKNVAVLLDQAGMGKTVVMHDVLESLETQCIDVLAIKADLQLTDVSELADVQKALNLSHPIEQTLSRLAKLNRVVIIIDQIDALSLSLARDQKTLNIILDFIARVRHIPNIRLLISCRQFDYNSDPRLQNIGQVRKFSLSPLSMEKVNQVLFELKIDVNLLSSTTKYLLQTPLHLDLFARVAANSTTEQLQGLTSLQELYALIWQHIILGQKANSPLPSDRLEVVEHMTRHMVEKNTTTMPRSMLSRKGLDSAIAWLASEGILLSSKTSWTFLHQTFLDYNFARQFVDSGEDIVDFILNSAQALFERPKLAHVMEYMRGTDQRRYLRDLTSLLNDDDLRFHLYDMLMRWLGSLSQPMEEEWSIFQRLLNDEARWHQVFTVIIGNPAWLEHIQPKLLQYLSQNENSKFKRSIDYLSTIAEKEQETVASILQPFLHASDDWNQHIIGIVSRIRMWKSEDLANLYAGALCATVANNHYMMWDVPQIVRFSPTIGCKILLHVFDDSLNKSLAKALIENGKVKQLPSDIFQNLSNHADSIEKALQYLSREESDLWIDRILPWVEKVVSVKSPSRNQDWYDSDILSHNWYENTLRIRYAIAQSLITSLTKVARASPQKFHSIAQRLRNLPYATPQQLLTHIYRRLPEQYASEAYAFLMADDRRLDIGDSAQYDSRQLITSIYDYLSEKQQQALENKILNFLPIYPTFGLESLRRTGIEQYRFLHAIPNHLRSEEGQKRYQEWKRKFPNYTIPDEPSRIRPVETGWVGSPIDENVALKMSDANWLKAIDKYRDGHRSQFFLKGGARELARMLQELIKEDPNRFYHLYQQMEDNLDDAYVEAFLEGFSASPETAGWLFEIIDRFASQPERNLQRKVSKAIMAQVNNVDVPDRILELLLVWIDEPMGQGESWQQWQSNHAPILTSYINSDRGVAFQATMSVLRARADEISQNSRWQLIEGVANDPSTVLRLGAVRELIYMLQYDRERAWDLFESLIQGHDALFDSQITRQFLYHSFYKNFLAAHPYMEEMAHRENEQAQKEGASLICIASISEGAMESEEAQLKAKELAEKMVTGRPTWRRGAARIYTHNMVKGSNLSVRRTSEAYVYRLLKDEDKKVLQEIDHAFHQMRDSDFERLKRFMKAYALTDRDYFEQQMSIYLHKHGIQDAEWSFEIIELLLHKVPRLPGWRFDVEGLVRLILLIHLSPLESKKVRDKALNILDLAMEKHSGATNKILREFYQHG